MEDILHTEVENAVRRRSRARGYLAFVLVLSLAAATAVGWKLHQTGVSATEDFFCGTEEHVHTEDCYTRRLTCGLEAGGTGHAHTEECYETKRVPVCQQEAHTHSEACYETRAVLRCTQEAHTHGEDCFDAEGNLLCPLPEHTHDDACYETQKVLTCPLAEHTHEEDCFETQSVLICGQEETGHHHGESCYETVLSCGKPEHTHGPLCLSDETADVETEAERLANAGNPGTRNWSQDLLAVARAQLGYRQSERNFRISEDGTHLGYTRYGADYGDPYGSWDGMFLAYCLRYSAVPEGIVPRNASIQTMLAQLHASAWLRQGNAETAQCGDIVFFEQTAGIVSQSGECLQAICGDVDGTVALCSVDASSVSAWVAVGEASAAYALPQTEENEKSDLPRQDEAENGEAENTQSDGNAAESEDDGPAVQEDNQADTSGMLDLGPMIAEISFEYEASANNWKPVENDTVTDGTKVRLKAVYHLNTGGSASRQAYYDVPEGFRLTGDAEGPIMVGDQEVARYQVKGQRILFTYTEELWNSPVVFEGTIRLDGVANLSDKNQESNISFPGKGTLKVTPKPASSGLRKRSTGRSMDEQGNILLGYRIILSSQTGMGPGLVTFMDRINTQGGDPGGILGYYKEGSFRLLWTYTRKNDDGTSTTKQEKISMDQHLKLSNNVCPESYDAPMPSFQITDLQPLEAGDTYELTYTVIVPPTSFQKVANGAERVFNYIEASSATCPTAKYADKITFQERVQKTGTYNPVTGRITWKISVYNPLEPDKKMTGTVLEDALPENLRIVGDIKVMQNNENGRVLDTISPSEFLNNGYTFRDNLPIAKFYVFVFETEFPPQEGALTFTNRATVSRDGVSFSREGRVGIAQGTWGISKRALSVQDGIAQWALSAFNANGTGAFSVLDQLLDASSEAEGEIQADSHYAIAAELQHAIAQNLRLTLTDGSTVDYAAVTDALTVRYYESANGEGTEIPSDDQTTHVHSFRLEFSSESVTVRSLSISSYPTHTVNTDIAMGDTWTYRNRAQVGNVYSEDSVSQTNYRTLDKRISTDGGKTYSGSGALTALPEGGVVDYEIELRIDAGTTAPLTLKDLVPAWESSNPNTPSFTAAYIDGSAALTVDGAPGGTVTATQEDNTLTFLLSDYNPQGNARVLLLHYKLNLSADHRWKDLTYFSWKYTNSVSWGNTTDAATIRVDRRSESLIKQLVSADKGSNRVEYRVFINLNEKNYGHELVLKDTVTYPQNISVTLDRSSVALYYYRVDSDGELLLTDPVPQNRYFPMEPDAEEACLLKLKVPDETAMVLCYACDVVIPDNLDDAEIENLVSMEDGAVQSGNISAKIQNSDFTITYGQLHVNKTDSISGKLLPNAVFTILEYEKETGTWQEILEEKTDAKGRFSVSVTPSQSQHFTLRPDTLYCVVEKKAPDSYLLDQAPHYVLFFDEKQGKDGAFARAVGQKTEVAGIGKPDEAATETVTEGMVSYCASNQVMSLNIQNAPEQLLLEKVWLDIDGIETAAPEGVNLTVDIYQKDEGDAPAKTVTLSAENNWKMDLSNELPMKTETGDPIFYYVVERSQNGKPLDPNWQVRYGNNDGIQTGTIYIYNRIYGYELPKTGGIGTEKLVCAGVCLMALAGLGAIRKKKERR